MPVCSKQRLIKCKINTFQVRKTGSSTMRTILQKYCEGKSKELDCLFNDLGMRHEPKNHTRRHPIHLQVSKIKRVLMRCKCKEKEIK